VRRAYEALAERVRREGRGGADDAGLLAVGTHAFFGVGLRHTGTGTGTETDADADAGAGADMLQAQAALTHAALHARASLLCRADVRQAPELLVRQALMEHAHGNLERAHALYMLAGTHRPADPVPLLGLRMLHLERPALGPHPRTACIAAQLHTRLARLFRSARHTSATDVAHHAALADANPVAATILATCHHWGWGVPADPRRAIAWLLPAAHTHALPAAAVALAMLLLPDDPVRAVRLFRSAADAGHAAALVNLGMAHYLGVGVPQSDHLAAACFRKGADAQDDRAFEYLAYCAVEGRGLPKSTSQALQYMQSALDCGSPVAPAWIRRHNARLFFQPAHLDSYCALQ
jgi:TPR repeat protein